MLVAEKMNQVTVAILKRDRDAVLEAVARLGVLHPVQLEEAGAWAKDLSPTDAQQLAAAFTQRRATVQGYIDAVPPHRRAGVIVQAERIHVPELAEVDATIALIEAQVAPLAAAQQTATAQYEALTSLAAQVELLLPSGLPLSSLLQSAYLASGVGTLQERQVETLKSLLAGVPHVVFPYGKNSGRVDVVCVVLRKDKSLLDESLHAMAFEAAALPEDLTAVSLRSRAQITRELATLNQELVRIGNELAAVRLTLMPDVAAAAQNIDAALALLQIKEYCRETEASCVFSGWVPADNTAVYLDAIRAKSGGRASVEVLDADAVPCVGEEPPDVPVLIRQSRLLQPFQLLIDSFGVPSYHMINPTLFAAVSFLFMFGMMFGDVGHGLVLAIAGAGLWKRGIGEAGKLVLSCGLSSMVFGFLYGSIFGFEHAIPTLWVKPLENVNAVFVAAIGFGVILISAGLVLNFINAVRRHAVLHELFEEAGPLAAIAYWSAIGIAVKTVIGGGDAQPGVLLWFVLVPLVALFAKGPILLLAGVQEKAFPEGVVGYVMECVVKVLEVLMGFLANTVSFIRVAAFGMAHAGLFIAVFSIADAVAAGATGQVASWAVLLIGNVVVIVLEGLVVTIQALRLEYYEFFGKFFTTVGTRYQPITFPSAALHKAD